MDIASIMTWLMSTSLGQYITPAIAVLGALVTIASIIAPFTKTPKDDEAVSWIKALIHRFSVISPQSPSN